MEILNKSIQITAS